MTRKFAGILAGEELAQDELMDDSTDPSIIHLGTEGAVPFEIGVKIC